MYDLTLADFKTYGVEIEPLKRNKMPLKNRVTLIKSVPAKIIKWQQRIEVEEGNATAVECKATGRPTPSVTITRNNLTLCNSTGHCVYEIPAANKSVHEGEYLCLAQQRTPFNSSQIKRSLSLTVLESRKIPVTDTAGHRTKEVTTGTKQNRAYILILIVVIVLGLALGLVFFCHRHVLKIVEQGIDKKVTKPRNSKNFSDSSSTETDVILARCDCHEDRNTLRENLDSKPV